MRMPRIYIVGSLRDPNNPKKRNPKITKTAGQLRKFGYDVFDDWLAPGPEADDWWKKYEEASGRTYKEALQGHAAKHVFEFDKSHIDESDIGILILPAGRSGHLELGYMIGNGKPGYILMDRPDRWDIMYQFATRIFFSFKEMVEYFKDNKKVRKDIRDAGKITVPADWKRAADKHGDVSVIGRKRK